jgi:cytochrome c biogenesis protein CcdA/thiol-disulfide isomerase/thioredoxin
MTLFVLAFLGGILTVLSPCILPVLPFVFSTANQSFRRSGIPLLAGMALTFAALAAVATVGGGWIVGANRYGRAIAMALLAIFGLALLWDGLAERLSRPFLRLGSQLASAKENGGNLSVSRSLVLGVATGLLWAPCAGPILGLILTGAAVGGASLRTASLLLAYAAGAAVSLGVALFAGQRIFGALKRSLGAEVWFRRVLGAAVLAGVAMIAFGLDRGLLTRVSLANTSGVEQSLVDRLQPKSKNDPAMMMMSSASSAKAAGPETLPDLSSASLWLNSQPLNAAALKGHVVLIDFWTYSCINCLRTLPYIRAWADRYKDSGLIVIGVHTPEFAFEKEPDNVRRAVKDLNITYPVALDDSYGIWKAFNNQYWPADYIVDATGRIRHHHFGEGNYGETEKQLQEALKDANSGLNFAGAVAEKVAGAGREAAPDNDVQSPETYLGYERADSFMPEGGLHKDSAFRYAAPEHLELNQWSFAGRWTDGPQMAILNSAPGRIVYRFHARDVHLVLGAAAAGGRLRFRVRIDGKTPGEDHGVDTDAQGNGAIGDHRLYQLIRQKGAIADHTFEIEFLDAGAQAFAFTFG